MDPEQRLVTLERSRLEVRPASNPPAGELLEPGGGLFGIDPLGALLLRFDVDEVLLGVDLPGKVLDRSRPVGSM